MLGGAQLARAQVTYFWRGDSAEGDGRNWQVANNWWRGFTEAPAGSEIIIFDNNHKTEQNTNNLSATSRYRLLFNSGASSARTITGTTENVFFDFSSNVPKIENNDTGTKTLAFPIGIGFNNAEINPVSGSLTLDRLDLRGNNVNVYGNNGHTLRIRGELRGSGSGTIAIQQNSTVIIAGTATNMGTMTINAGVLQYEATTGAGHTNTINVGDTSGSAAARLAIGAADVTVSNRISVRSGSSGQKTIANVSSGSATFSGAVTLNTSLTISNGNGGSLLFSGPVDFNGAQRFITLPTAHTATMSAALSNDGGNGLVKQGGGELILGASNNIVGLYIDVGAIRYTGTVAHVRGVIDIGPGSGSGDARLILATGGLTVTNRIESKNTTGTRNLDAVNTSGTITLSGSNLLSKELTYDVASGGTLDVTGIVAGGGVLNKVGSGTMILSGNNLFTGNSIVSGGVLRISHANALGTTAGSNIVVAGATLEVTGGITVADPMSVGGYGVNSNGVIRNVSDNNTLSGGIQATSVIAIGVASASDTLTLSGVISAPSATNNIIKNGPGILVLSGNNTFTSQLDIQSGVLSVNSINSSASAAQPLGSRTTSPAIRLGSTDSSGTSRGTLRYTGASDATLPKTIRLTEGAEGGLDINNDVTVTANGVISAGSTAAWLIKSGIGRVTLDAINTYEGRTVITQGVLRVLNSSSLGNTNDSDNQATYVWPGASMEAALEISGGTSLRERIYLAGEGVSSGGALRNISGDNTLTGRVFFSAATRISSDSGTLNLSNSTAITSAFGLTLAGAGDIVWNTPLNTGANTLTKDGSGTATIHSTNTYSGATTVSNGTLVIRGSSANSAHTVMGGATLRGAGTIGALTIFGTVDPGNATGDRATLTTGNLTLQTNGAMRVDISNVSGTPGTDWDQISAGSGSITVNATTTDRFTIQLNGNPSGWDNSVTYSWRIVAAGSVSGFDTNKFTVNTSGFTPALGGGMFSVTNSAGNLFLVFFPGTAGDIDVRGNGVVIAPGDTTPSLADHTLFGDVLTSGGTQQRVYTITNSGSAAIGLGNISFSGGNAGDFTVINQPPGSLPAGGSTNITIEFDPDADGERWTDLTFTNTVASKSPYTFRIAGTGVTYNLDVRGNGVIIADGDSTPSTADHTDFGSVGVAGDTLTRTFTITNSGNRDLSVSNVFIIGTHASDFTVTAQPSATMAPGATTTFQVQFDPSAVGLRTAEIVFTNTSTTGKNPYNFAIQGTGVGSGITNSPLSLSFSSTLGSLPSPSFQTFGVTNVGLGTLTYTLSTNASWLFLTGSGSTAAAGAGNTHTAHVQMVGVMAAGTSNATITITGDSATTNSPKTISVTWTINAIPDPSAAAASPEGAEFVRLSWTKHASHDVMITYNRSNAPPAPANGTSYNVGDSVGSGAIVLYKGAASGFEHVVPKGSTNFYAFYSINNDYYSPGLTRGATADVYKVYEIVEPFSYTNALTLNGRTNQGWAAAGTWTNTGNAYVIVSNVAFTAISGYPTAAGNIITGQSATAFRVLPQAYSSGKVYIGFMFRASGVGATEYAGLSVFNGGNEEVFIGERFSTTAQLGLEVPGGSTGAGPQLSANTEYTIIARYDLDADTIDAVLYTNATQSVPDIEPATWHVSISDSSPPAQVDRIRLDGNVGMRWDEIRIATNYYELLNITATEPALFVGPTNIALSLMKGNTASATFVVTNQGSLSLLYTNTITYGSGSGWLTVAPTGGTVAGVSSRIHTGTVSAVGLAAGSYIATNRVAGNQTNSPVNVIFDVTVTNIPAPTAVTATNDGNELVRMAWTAAGSLQVMIVHRANADITADPTDNTAYNVGDTIGGGTVIFKGTASSREHVVATGSTNYYRFYSVNNNHYSPNVAVAATTGVYKAGERVDQFAYTNAVALNGLNGGQGFTNAWAATAPNASVDVVVDNADFSTFQPNWPPERANRIVLKTTNSSTYTAVRHFNAVTSGKLYVAALYRREFNEGATDGKFSGISLMDGSNERMFIGEVGGASSARDDVFGVGMGASVTTAGGADSFPAATDYLLIGRYDFDTGIFAGIYYTNNVTVPAAEPTFLVFVTNSFSKLDGVRFASGADSGWNGQVFFDELRIATNWAELLLLDVANPYATNYIIGNATNHVSDAQVNAGAFPVMIALRADGGIESTNTSGSFFQPNFDLITPNNVQILTDHVFSTFTYLDGGLTLIASNTTHAGAAPESIVLGVYTARWSAISSNGFSTINSTTLSNGTAITFTVFDDDVTTPDIVTLQSTNTGGGSFRLMHISLGAANITGSGASNAITYTTTDAALAGVSAANPLSIWLGARDSSGLNRDTSNASTNSHLSIGSVIVSNVANFDATRSSGFAETSASRATNVWTWPSPFSHAQLEHLVTNTAAAGSNAIVMVWRDGDKDRSSDFSSFTYTQGWFVVNDDDVTPPTIQNFRIFGAEGSYTVRVDELTSGTGWAITGRVSDASGINVNGAETNQPNNSPYFELWDFNGTLRFRKAFSALGFTDGGATSLSSVSNGAEVVSGVTFSDVGIWTARVIVADNDEDFGNNDHAIGTNEFAFSVIAGATLGGIGRGPASFAVTSSFGTVTSTNPWPVFFVTNIGSGTLNYNATITYSGAGGWLTVAPTNGTLTGNGSSRNHTNSIDASGLAPGLYSATITLNGDQTNAAQTITISLRVFGFYPGEIVDQFTNTSGSLDATVGGTGWVNAWSNNPSSGFAFSNTSLTVPGNYPSSLGNKICGDTSSDTELRSFRYFNEFTTGKVFMAVAVRKTDGNSDGFNGISFMSNAAEVAFAGKIFNNSNFGIDLGANGGNAVGSFGVNGTGDPGYFYIGMYDFASNRFVGRAYNNSDSLPSTEPSWQVTGTPTVAIGSINGIRVAARNEGTFCFDEIRVATSWEGLLLQFTNEPNVHASGISFRDVTTNSMVVGWTPGNGGNRIVVAREGSAVTFLPTDNSNYAANANFPVGTDLGGGQRVVYNGGGTNFTLTGLTETTRYFFAIFEYNGSPPNYYTNAGYATGDRWTLASEPATNATAFAAHTVSETAISNTWVAAAGTPAPDGYLVVRFTNTIAFLPQDGVGYTNGQVVNGGEVVRVVTPGSATTVLHTNLTACRLYHFRIFSFRWNGSAAETYNYYTNASPTATAETECAEPTIQASNIVFSSIGTNRITLSWDVGNGDARLVVVRGTNEVNAHPSDGTSYTANPNFGSGSHLGGGNYVVFSGTGTTVTVTGLVPAVTYHFRVYEYNGSGSGVDYNTNTAVQNPRSVATIAQGLIYEGFDYGAFVNMSGQSGGTGWTNSWSTSGGLVESGSGNFPDFGAYPPDTPSSTRSGFIDLGNASEDTSGFRALRRHFEPFTSGKFVMALKINDNHSMSSSDYLGVNILNGAAVTAFVGKASGVADRRLSVEHNGQVRTNRIDNTNDGYQLNAGTDYLIVFEYDFNTKRLSARAYVQSQVAHALPDREAAWIVEMTNVTISKIDGIQIIARDANQVVTFDSIRIGPSWEEVMWALPEGWHTANGPVPSLVYIGTNYGPSVYNMVITNLSDAELVSMNLIDFAIRWDASYGGIFLTNNTATNLNIGSHNARVTPNWDPLAVGAATNEFNLDRFFTNYFGINGSTVVTTYQKAGFNITNLNFDLQYFVTVSAEAAPAGAPTVPAPNGSSWAAIPTNRAITINYPLRFYVYDDDTNAPVFGSRPLRVFTNSVIASAQSVGDLERYFVYDGVLTQAGMRLMFNVYDDYSGLQRASTGSSATNMSITVPYVATNNVANYEAAWSSVDSLIATATSTWSFANSLFTWDRVTAMWGGDGSGSQGQDIEVTITVPDADADRVDDQMIMSSNVAGYIRLLDDDEVPPEAQNVEFSGAAARPFFVLTNLFAIGSGDTLIRGNYDRRSGTSSNTVFAVTDEEMAQAGTRSLQFAFGARDVHSGIGRGTSGSTNEVMSFSIGAGFMSGVVTGWSASLSTPASGANVLQTNIWTFNNSSFSETVITQLMAVTGPSGSGSNRVAVTIPDSDNDRLNDQSRATDLTVGWLRVFDDDIKGPSMTALQVDNAYSDEAVLFTSFETSEGWPSFQASGSLWTNILTNGLGTGVWYGTGYVNLNDAAGGNRKAGFTVTGVGQYFEMPARQDVGKVTLDARLSSGTTPRHLELQYWSGTNWASAGTNEISSPDYAQLTWNVDVPGLTTLRIVRVGTDGTPGIYMDNLLVTQSGFLTDTNAFGWTNLTSVTVRWNHATDDYSGIDEYRKVAPAIGSTTPTATNSGSGISGSTTSQVVSLLHQQGTITGFIFAIDNDNDRSNDRAMGNVISYRLRIDTNPPLAVLNPTNITDDPLVDETTEVKVQWTPASTNMEIAAGWRVSDSTALSPWDTYIITVHELDGSFNPINTTVITRLNGPANLGSNNTSSIVISNLNFDAFHRIRIAARDKAGNIGPEVVVTGLTVNFQVTQGISRVFSPGTNGVRLAWIASTNRVYDQLFVDSMNLTDSLSNQWNWVDRITNNFAGGNMLVDEGGYNPTNHFRVMPELLGATMRFYRVSLQDAWQPSNVVRRGSREVYVTKPIRLVPGENWYSAFFAPDTATVAYVFGTNRVPAGSTYATATRIHWFSPTNIGGSSYNHITNTVALIGSGSGGTWMQWTGALGGVMNDWEFPVNQGFMIEMPSGASTVRLPIVGRVVTQQQVIAITGVPTGTNNFHILNWNYPVRVSLTGALFRGSGMVGHNFVTFADEVRILDNTKGLGSLSQPKARWHLRSDQTTWQLVSWSTNYYASAPTLASFRIEPEDVVVIVRRNPGIMNWTNRVYYTPPGKNFNP